jgi:hypothetical protein
VFSLNALETPEHMTFSYINHPIIVAQILPLIEQTYKSLGIETEFIVQPSSRGLRNVSKGLMDGEAIYGEILVGGYNNLLLIPPSLGKWTYVLLCALQVPCNSHVIENEDVTIVLTDSSRVGLQDHYQQQQKSHLYIINRIDLIHTLIGENRFSYGLYIMNDEQLAEIQPNDIKYVRLFSTETYHIIHKKHAYLAPAVSAALKAALNNSPVIGTQTLH